MYGENVKQCWCRGQEKVGYGWCGFGKVWEADGRGTKDLETDRVSICLKSRQGRSYHKV